MNNIPEKEEKKQKKILIATNHAYMLWQFRRELIAELKKEHEVILSLPFDKEQHEKPFQKNIMSPCLILKAKKCQLSWPAFYY